MKTKFYLLACLLCLQFATKAQMKIGDNSTSINSASLLELETTSKGLVLPRVSLTNVSSSSPLPAGLLTSTVVYNTNAGTTGGSGAGIYYWDGSKWNFLANTSITSNYWSLTGNSGLSASTNFIGTTDATDFVVRTANTERMHILGANSGSSKAGWIGMGIVTPRSSLDVTGDYTNKNVLTLQNTSSTGFTSIDMLDNTGALKGTFGYANSGTGGNFASRTYFNSYGSDLLFTANSGTYHLFLKGGTGYIGINTNTPSERLHVVGNIYLNGAFMPGGDAGTSGYVLTSAGTNTSPTWSSVNNLSWSLKGNSSTSYPTNFLGTTDNISMRFRTNNIQRMIIDSIGNVGIGTAKPGYALSVLAATNPLYLSGVQTTSILNSAATSDSILTIYNGVVKKAPYSSLTGNFWSTTGNSGTSYATNFIGTTDNISLRFRTNNTEQMILDSLGNLSVGSYGAPSFNPDNPPKLSVDYNTTTSNTIAYFRGSIDDYFQMNLRNKSNGTYASTDYVATSDDGTDSTNYIDMGINGSAYAPSVDNFGGPHDGYLYTYSRNLLLGTAKTNSDIIFLAGGGQTKFNAAMRIDGTTGNIIIGKGENNNNATGNIIRGPNAANGSNIAGGSITLQGGASNGNNTGGNVNLYGGGTVSGTYGSVNINANTNSAANINTGTSGSNITMGGGANNILLPKFATVGGLYYTSVNTGQLSTTGSNMTWDSINNRLGIGITNPGYKLSVLSSSNPLYLSGVQTTATLSSDSILTIYNGVVKKSPYSILQSGGSGWALTGNSGTSAGTNFLGTTDAEPLVIKSLSRQLAYFDGNLYSIALGYGAVNGSSDHNIAIGYNATTNNQYTLAVGYNATATGVRSVAIGNGAAATTASGGESIAIGYNAISSANQTVSLGYQAKATGQYGLALGYGAQASALQSTAIGYSSLASAQYSNAIGYQAQATATQSTAIGYQAQTAQSNTILLGSTSTNNLYVGIGTSTPSSKLDIVANAGFNPLELHGLPTGVAGTDNILTLNSSGVVGYVTPSTFSGTYWSLSGNAAASGSYLGTTNSTPLQFKFNNTSAGYLDANNTSFGTNSTATSGSSNTAIGYSSTASNSATAIGANAAATASSNTAVGNSAVANISSQATAIGASSQALYQYNTALGYNAQATSSSQETVIGASAQAQGQNNVAVGYSAKAINSDKITVVGSSAQASYQNNTVVGYGATATSNNQATSVGAASDASAQNATALGYNASASGANSTAIGYNATTSQSNALVLGISTTNVGIRTSTPNTSAGLDVNANFKLGDIGTVNKNVVSFTSAIGSTNLVAGSGGTIFYIGTVTFQASSTDITLTIPSSANYLTSTKATVTVSPAFDLPTGVSIASARMISTSQVKIRLVNATTDTQTVSGSFYVTINEF